MERKESNKRRKLNGGKGKTLKRTSAIEKEKLEEEKAAVGEPKKYESGSEEEYVPMNTKKPTETVMQAVPEQPKEESSDDEFKEKLD